LGELSLDMETTSNRLDFVQVCCASHHIGSIHFTLSCHSLDRYDWSGFFWLRISTTWIFSPFICVQKRVAMVMKKASLKGQIMIIVFLVFLFIILFVLVFLTWDMGACCVIFYLSWFQHGPSRAEFEPFIQA
jgi:hypothetical protein